MNVIAFLISIASLIAALVEYGKSRSLLALSVGLFVAAWIVASVWTGGLVRLDA